MEATAIVQARMGSTRLPGKVLRQILGHPMLWHIVRRVKQAPGVEQVVVATSDQAGDEPIRHFCQEAKIDCFAGNEQNVLDRFYQAAVNFSGDPLLRITGDCPFVDPTVIGRVLTLYRTNQFDHVSAATGAGAIFLDGYRYPDGLDAECFSFAALQRTWQEATAQSDREHVTPYMWRVPDRFCLGIVKADKDYSHLRWTVDTDADFQMVVQIYDALYPRNSVFLMEDILAYLDAHPALAETNQFLIGREGYHALWKPD